MYRQGRPQGGQAFCMYRTDTKEGEETHKEARGRRRSRDSSIKDRKGGIAKGTTKRARRTDEETNGRGNGRKEVRTRRTVREARTPRRATSTDEEIHASRDRSTEKRKGEAIRNNDGDGPEKDKDKPTKSRITTREATKIWKGRRDAESESEQHRTKDHGEEPSVSKPRSRRTKETQPKRHVLLARRHPTRQKVQQQH